MLQRKSYLLGGMDIPWKTFVRESNETEERASEERIYRLRFHGSQARAAYEEILSQECNAKPEPERVKPQRNERTVCLNERTKRSQSSEGGNVKVTVNGILKAVEQRDLEFLLKHVTLENVNWTDDFGWTPLMSAAYCGYLEIIELLLSRGANKRTKDRSGLTAAQLALKKNHLGVVALLRKKSENFNDKPLLIPVPIGASQDKARENSESRKESEDSAAHRTLDSSIEQSVEGTGFHCEVCDADFKHSTRRKHESSTLHIFNSKPKLSYVMYGISKQNKGYQMLLNTGWDEQNGLGPSGKGIKYPLKTCLKTDRKGLGQAREKEYRVTHFKAEDPSAVSNCSTAKQKCLKKRDRERLLNREARKPMDAESEKLFKHLHQVEMKAGEILTDRQEIVALDKRRNEDRVGMRALEKDKSKKTWITVGPLLIKMPTDKAKELLQQDQIECDVAINKLRSNLKVKVNELRDLELNPPVPGLMLQALSPKEMSAMKHVLGQGP